MGEFSLALARHHKTAAYRAGLRRDLEQGYARMMHKRAVAARSFERGQLTAEELRGLLSAWKRFEQAFQAQTQYEDTRPRHNHIFRGRKHAALLKEAMG